jgi:4-hydroxy-3-methylbut-2-enyl diphosphate reductase IspH
MGLSVVRSIEDLPPDAGVYVSAYDGRLEDLEILEARGTASIHGVCPWVERLRMQLLEIDARTHQAVFLADREGLTFRNYESIIPQGTIVVSPDGYEQEIRTGRDGRPLHFVAYATFRPEDARAITDHIERAFPHPLNRLDGAAKTLCGWTRQGLFEELREAVPAHALDQLWVLCTSSQDRSTSSIFRSASEAGVAARAIKSEDDLPDNLPDHARVGVIVAPLPLPKRTRAALAAIRSRWGQDADCSVRT